MGHAATYEPLGGDLHRHGGTVHSHHHHGPHDHSRGDGHGHTHGLVDPSIKRSRAGLVAVGVSLAPLAGVPLADPLIGLGITAR